MQPVERESVIEAYLKKCVKAAGGEVRKVRWIGRRGAPDRFVMMRGIACFVELKRPGGEAEEHQIREHERLLDAGCFVAVVDTKAKVDEFISDMRGVSRGGL